MILDHVADGAGPVVKGAPALDAEALRHGDLHALDMVAVPDGLQESVREAEEEHVVHRPLAEVVVDAEDRRLVEAAEQRPVQLPRRGEVRPKGFFDDHAGALGTARLGQLIHDQPEQRGRDGEIMRGPLRGAELCANGLERRRVRVVAIDIAQQAAQLLEGHRVESSVRF